MDASPITQGLIISVAGLIVAFASMASFILVIILLQKFFPPKVEAETSEASEADEQSIIANEEEEAVVAAIAAALYIARAKVKSKLGAELQTGRSNWWAANVLAARQETVLKK